MDGVLVDFHSRYDKLYGSNAEENQRNWSTNWKHWVLTQQFRHLDWAPGGKTLYNFVKRLNIPFEILSSSGGADFYDEIKEQKIYWLQKNGFTCPINIVPGKKYKQEYAKPNYLIIDDTWSIIEQWRNAGGFAIFHDHDDVQSTIDLIIQYMYEDSFN